MYLIKEYLGSIAGVEILAIISMLIFILIFIVMIIHTFSFRKEEVREYSQFPLDEDEEGQNKE